MLPVPTVAERLDRLIEIARRRWIFVISLTVLAAAAGILAAGGTKQYTATSKVLLSDSPIVPSSDPSQSSTSGDPERDVNTQVGLVTLGTVADRVDARLRLNLSEQALVGKVKASPQGTTNIVAVSATDASPTRARAIANAFADEYVAFRKRVAQSTLNDARNSVRGQLASLSRAQRASGQGAALKSRLHQLQIASAIQTGGAAVVFRAPTPTSPSAPRPLRSAVLGGLAGFMLALVIVIVLELRTPRVRDEDLIDPWIADEGAELKAPLSGRAVDPRPVD
jgi:tyrosine-protein kinase